jgi:hypothetical protein
MGAERANCKATCKCSCRPLLAGPENLELTFLVRMAALSPPALVSQGLFAADERKGT